jgi:uncharacterized protein
MHLSARLFSPPIVSPRSLCHQKINKKNNHKTMKTQILTTFKTALHVAFLSALCVLFSCNNKETATDTTKTGSKIDAPDVDIHTAVLTSNQVALKQHIEAGTNINEKDPFGGSSPLITACVFGKTEAAKILIDAGADLNFQNNDGSTALHSAAFFCRPEIVAMLLDKGADKSITNKFGATPYQSVAGSFAEAKPAYDMIGKLLQPMGLQLDYAHIEKTRPVVAEMLK